MSSHKDFWAGFLAGAFFWLYFVSTTDLTQFPISGGFLDAFFAGITADGGIALKSFLVYSVMGGLFGNIIGVLLNKRG